MDERKTWQDNTGLLYDFLNNMSCEWPGLSVEWMETTSTAEEGGEFVARFLMGTCADGPRENYVYLMDVNLGEGATISMEHREYSRRADRLGFAYGKNGDSAKYSMVKRIHVPLGDIHRVRSSRVDGSHLAACVCASGEGVVFSKAVDANAEAVVDITSHIKEGDGRDSVIARLYGHDAPAWGLAWSLFDETQLVTSSDDNRICTWNLNKTPHDASSQSAWKNAKTITPVTTYSTGHTKAIQCVSPHYDHPGMFISAGDDGQICVWDSRISDHEHAYFPIIKEPSDAFNAISQNSFRTHLLATGGSGSDVCLWDLRNCGYPLGRLTHYDSKSAAGSSTAGPPSNFAVNSVAFNEHHDYLLASGGSDARIVIWDMRDIGKEQSAENAQDGPPELLFVHQGHVAPVQDLCWGRDDAHEFYISSVSDANEWQIWSFDQAVFHKENSEEDSDNDLEENFPVE